jgi:hypothetical protein
MKEARLYDNPNEFAGMMIRHLSEALTATAQQVEDQPLLLKLSLQGRKDEEVQISLHSPYQTYMNTGDLNMAIDHLNGVISSSQACQNVQEATRIDLSCVYPALRDTRYVEEAGRDMDFITERSLPGLNIIYIEIHDNFSKIINRSLLDNQQNLTEERVKRIAFRNMRSEGWIKPNLSLPSPSEKSCVMDIYTDNHFPIECQFLNPDLVKENIPHSYLIAFTNRTTIVAMRSTEEMDTAVSARRLAKKSLFNEIVRRSYLVMPYPNSDRIYWMHKGTIQQL